MFVFKHFFQFSWKRKILVFLIILIAVLTSYHALSAFSNTFIKYRWEKGRRVTTLELLRYSRNADEKGIDWLNEFLLDYCKNNYRSGISMFFLSAARSASCGYKREIRLVYRILNDRRWSNSFREACVIALAASPYEEGIAFLEEIAEHEDDPIADFTRELLTTHHDEIQKKLGEVDPHTGMMKIVNRWDEIVLFIGIFTVIILLAFLVVPVVKEKHRNKGFDAEK